MIRSSLTAVPRRLPVLWGKLAVFAGVIFPVSLVASFISFFLGQALLNSHHSGCRISAPDALRSVIGAALYVTVAGLDRRRPGRAVPQHRGRDRHLRGSLLRDPAAGRPAALLDQRPPVPVPALERGRRPSGAGRRASPNALSPWTGFALLCGYAVVLIAAAAWRLRRVGRLTGGAPGDNVEHEAAQARRVPSEPHRGPLGTRRAGHPARRGLAGCPRLYQAPTAPPPPASIRGGSRWRCSCWPRRCWSAGSGPSRCSAGPGRRQSPRSRRSRSPHRQRPGPAHRPVHGGDAAAAPRRAGLRGRVRADHRRRCCSCSRAAAGGIRRSSCPGWSPPPSGSACTPPPAAPTSPNCATAPTGWSASETSKRALAVAAERARIAREMHDIVAHHLTVMVTLERGGDRRVGQLPGALRAGHRRHAQRGGHRADARWPIPAGSSASCASPRPDAPPTRSEPRRGGSRGAAAGPRPRPARRAHRAGPLRRTGHHAGDPRRRRPTCPPACS